MAKIINLTLMEAILEAMSLRCFYIILSKEPFQFDSEAILIETEEDDKDDCENNFLQNGYVCFLDSEDMKELFKATNKKAMSFNSIVEFIIHYAINDGSPFWYNDIKDV